MIRSARIDERTWGAAALERRRELRLALDEIVAEHVLAPEPQPTSPLALLVTYEPPRVVCELHEREGAAPFARIELPLPALEPTLREYFDLCEQMAGARVSQSSPQLEALDIAKRLVHDEAAETLRAHLGALRPDHATARRFFTLLVTLHFDTGLLGRPHHLDAALERRRFRGK